MLDIVGHDVFLEALNDQSLRVRILEKEPKTLDKALNVASRLEAFDRVENRESKEEEYHRKKGRSVRAAIANHDEPTSSNGSLEEQVLKKMSQFQEQLEKQRRETEALKRLRESKTSGVASFSGGTQEQTPSTPQPDRNPTSGGVHFGKDFRINRQITVTAARRRVIGRGTVWWTCRQILLGYAERTSS